MKKLDFLKTVLACIVFAAFIAFIFFLVHMFLFGKESLMYAIPKYYIPSAIIGMCVIIGFVLLAFVAATAIDNKWKECDSEGSYGPNAQKVMLNDVIVTDELKRELKITCNNVSEGEKKMFEKLDYKPSGGYIFYGPPGTGKTLLARAIAGETNSNFINVAATELITKFVGGTAKNIRNLFETARKKSPCIIFIDEIDAIGQNRSSNDSGYAQSNNQAVIELLTQMNDGKGNQRNKGVVVIAATNRLETLDSALLRPGRFDKKIEITLPDANLRKRILDLYTKAAPLSSDLNLEEIAGKTEDFSGADLAYLVNEVKRHVVERTEGTSTADLTIIVLFKTNDKGIMTI